MRFQLRGTALSNASGYLWLPAAYLANAIEEKPQRTKEEREKNEYFANVGDAIRTLREDIPSLFNRDLNCRSQSTALILKGTHHKLLFHYLLLQMISTGMISSSETLETACMASETTKFSSGH
jgi:hypothetical protein